ncbi:MAG TPA: hypothetical protein VGG85_09990 [Terracidiphilus sp.]
MKITLAAAAMLLASWTQARAAAPSDCWNLDKHGHRAEAQRCFETLTHSGDAYLRAEGFWGLEQWQQANEQFRVAAQAANAGASVKVRWGMLLHARFNDAEAADLFREALAKEPTNAGAYLGLAYVSAGTFSGKAAEYAGKAAELDPKNAEPHELIADLALTNDDVEAAGAEADKAIALARDALDALAIHAALDLIANRSADAWFAKIQAVNPNYGEAYARVAHQLELHYRFQDAVTYYRKAIEADPRQWAAHSALGIELMRLGQDQEPRKELELAYENGYRDAATVNSLRLLDSYKNFVTVSDETTTIKLNKAESGLLLPYLQTELHTILATYEKKYQMKLAGRVQLEVYPDHEDFAVRTMGMPGLGALGVTFGQVVAMDSPSARKPGDFNWGSTLWHEMSHVFILSATNYRVPRWFTEGLAVHEEGEHSAEWKNQPIPEVLVAIRDKKLLPVTKLDRGFVFPEYPSQVIVSYFQAGSICDFVKARWSEAKLLEMVHSYAQTKTTPEVIKQDLGMAPEEFDKQYFAWLNERFGAEAAHFDTWREKLKALAGSEQQKKFDAVLQQGPGVIALYPEYVGDANAYELIADAAKSQGDAKTEATILTAYVHEGGQMPVLLKRLATLQDAAGHKDEAVQMLERVNYIYPVKDEELHRRLGELCFAQKKYDGAIREFAALVASDPVDKAGAEYSLAQAYLASGQKDKAQESVLAALEMAPGYRPAQKLLLELQQPSKTN